MGVTWLSRALTFPPTRTVSGTCPKNGAERERCSDPNPSWGDRSAISTCKDGGFYGYKVHAAVCAVTGLPLAWTVETASAAERTSRCR